MNIQIVKHINKDEDDRIEFLLLNYDYFDGNYLIAECFVAEFEMKIREKIEGIFSSTIKLYDNTDEYHLIWHEDIGNYIYALNRDDKSIEKLEKKLKYIVGKINTMKE